MDGLSVIIPSRNEKYLEPTIRNVLANARGEIEILAVLDGWIPDPQIVTGDDRVKFIHFEESIGQRQAINRAAEQATGKFIMKLDAHCAVDEGFDVKLARDCEYDWTVIPRMYNLDINTFKPKYHKRTDYMYMRVREDGQFRAEYYTGQEFRKQHLRPDLIDDTLCCMGPCFFMHKDRFFELGACDENHGGWGSQGIEVACKAWLSGGALKVNKKTWFAHWFRGGEGPGFPYKISGRQVSQARTYAKDLWLSDKWPLATRKFEWLINKFNPPGWSVRKMEKQTVVHEVYKPRSARSHVHGRPMSVHNLVANIEHYWDRRRQSRATGFADILKFFNDLKVGKTFTTDKQLLAHPYYDYIKAGFSTQNKAAFLGIMRDSIALFNSIKSEGLKCPLEMWIDKDKYSISRGTRRLAILYVLGTKWVAVKIYESVDFMNKFRPNEHIPEGSISDVAQKQFQRWGWKATDKYWIHNYTPLYSLHCGHLKHEKAKILEVGVKRGGSVRLWQEAFPTSEIYGMDIDIEQAALVKNIDRITLLKGSQTDAEYNKQVIVDCGPFDLIVDDASHIPDHQKKGFDNLWPGVKPGGWYVVEDLFYRNYFRNKGKDNMMAKLSKIVDDMNMQGEIEVMHMYYNICFIKKRIIKEK